MIPAFLTVLHQDVQGLPFLEPLSDVHSLCSAMSFNSVSANLAWWPCQKRSHILDDVVASTRDPFKKTDLPSMNERSYADTLHHPCEDRHPADFSESVYILCSRDSSRGRLPVRFIASSWLAVAQLDLLADLLCSVAPQKDVKRLCRGKERCLRPN